MAVTYGAFPNRLPVIARQGPAARTAPHRPSRDSDGAVVPEWANS